MYRYPHKMLSVAVRNCLRLSGRRCLSQALNHDSEAKLADSKLPMDEQLDPSFFQVGIFIVQKNASSAWFPRFLICNHLKILVIWNC